MEARIVSVALIVASLFSLGASSRSQNFLVTAPTPQLAAEVAQSAERYRRDLALEWLGHELPPWSDICPIRVQVGPHLGAGGATSFCFDRGRPFQWKMNIQGPQDRLLDSVLPHEITHMIFATHFGRPLPRWADEGACTTVEHDSEKLKQQQLLVTFLTTDRGIAFNEMFAMMDYPADMLPLYSQGFSLARFLIAQGGKRKFVQYIGDGMNHRNWTAATRQHYGYESLSELQLTWLDWVRKGYPVIQPQGLMVADASAGSPTPPPVQPSGVASDGRSTTGGTQLVAASFNSWYAREGRGPKALSVATTQSSTAGQPSTAAMPLDGQHGIVEPLMQSTASRAQGIGQPQPMVIPAGGSGQETLSGTVPPREPLPLHQFAGPSQASGRY